MDVHLLYRYAIGLDITQRERVLLWEQSKELNKNLLSRHYKSRVWDDDEVNKRVEEFLSWVKRTDSPNGKAYISLWSKVFSTVETLILFRDLGIKLGASYEPGSRELNALTECLAVIRMFGLDITNLPELHLVPRLKENLGYRGNNVREAYARIRELYASK